VTAKKLLARLPSRSIKRNGSPGFEYGRPKLYWVHGDFKKHALDYVEDFYMAN